MTNEQDRGDIFAMIAELPIDRERLKDGPELDRVAEAISDKLRAWFDLRQRFLYQLERTSFSPVLGQTVFSSVLANKNSGMAAIDRDAIEKTLPLPDWETIAPARVKARLALIVQAQGVTARRMAALLAVLPLAKYASAEMKALHEQTMATALYARWLLNTGYIPPEGCGVPVDFLQDWISKEAAWADERAKDFEALVDFALAPFQSALLRRLAPEAFVERPYEDAPAPVDVETETRLRATIDAVKPKTPREYLRALWREAFPHGFPASQTTATPAKEPGAEAEPQPAPQPPATSETGAAKEAAILKGTEAATKRKKGRPRADDGNEVIQPEAAAICGVTKKTIQNWEAGIGTPEGYPGRRSRYELEIWAFRYKERIKAGEQRARELAASQQYEIQSGQ